METLKELQKDDNEFFFTTIDETHLLKEKINILECLIKSLRIENERFIDENIKLTDELRTLKQKSRSLLINEQNTLSY